MGSTAADNYYTLKNARLAMARCDWIALEKICDRLLSFRDGFSNAEIWIYQAVSLVRRGQIASGYSNFEEASRCNNMTTELEKLFMQHVALRRRDDGDFKGLASALGRLTQLPNYDVAEGRYLTGQTHLRRLRKLSTRKTREPHLKLALAAFETAEQLWSSQDLATHRLRQDNLHLLAQTLIELNDKKYQAKLEVVLARIESSSVNSYDMLVSQVRQRYFGLRIL